MIIEIGRVRVLQIITSRSHLVVQIRHISNFVTCKVKCALKIEDMEPVYRVYGTLKGSKANQNNDELIFFKSKEKRGESLRRKAVWHQRYGSDSCRHLNRDYVCNETFEDIKEQWLPFDFKIFAVVKEMDAESCSSSSSFDDDVEYNNMCEYEDEESIEDDDNKEIAIW